MKVTGYQLREALRKWIQRSEVAHKLFHEGIWAFPGEAKDPLKLSETCVAADDAIATIEAAQQYYNLQVVVQVITEHMTLAKAVKLVGFAGRHEKEWRSAATDVGRDKWTARQTERSKDNEYATKTISVDMALKYSEATATRAAALRAAIATGNSTSVEIPDDVVHNLAGVL